MTAIANHGSADRSGAVMCAMYFALRYTERARAVLKPFPPPCDYSDAFSRLPLRRLCALVASSDPNGPLGIALVSLMRRRWPNFLDEKWPPETKESAVHRERIDPPAVWSSWRSIVQGPDGSAAQEMLCER